VDEADAFGLERICSEAAEQFRTAGCVEDEGNFGAVGGEAFRRGHEISKRRGTLLARNAPPRIRTPPSAAQRAVRRIGDDYVERCGCEPLDAARTQISADHAYRIQLVECGIAFGDRGQVGLDFDCYDFARKP